VCWSILPFPCLGYGRGPENVDRSVTLIFKVKFNSDGELQEPNKTLKLQPSKWHDCFYPWLLCCCSLYGHAMEESYILDENTVMEIYFDQYQKIHIVGYNNEYLIWQDWMGAQLASSWRHDMTDDEKRHCTYKIVSDGTMTNFNKENHNKRLGVSGGIIKMVGAGNNRVLKFQTSQPCSNPNCTRGCQVCNGTQVISMPGASHTIVHVPSSKRSKPPSIPCARCQIENPLEAKFCMQCGLKLKNSCQNCNRILLPTQKFCGGCGMKVKDEYNSNQIEGNNSISPTYGASAPPAYSHSITNSGLKLKQ